MMNKNEERVNCCSVNIETPQEAASSQISKEINRPSHQ